MVCEKGDSLRQRQDSLVARTVPPAALERDLVRRQSKERDLDIGRSKAGLDTGASAHISAFPLAAQIPCACQRSVARWLGGSITKVRDVPRPDGVDAHLDTHLCSRGIHHEVNRSGAARRDAERSEQIVGRAERVLGAGFILFLLDLKSQLRDPKWVPPQVLPSLDCRSAGAC